MNKNPNAPRLLYTQNADWLYATGMPVSDPHPMYQDSMGETHSIVSPLEFAVAKATSTLTHVHSHEEIKAKITARKAKPALAEMINQLILDDPNYAQNMEITTPANFPTKLYLELTELGLKLTPTDGSVFPERGIKTTEEIEKIHKAQKANEAGFKLARKILSAAKIGTNDFLFWNNEMLTSEILRAEIQKNNLDNGCVGFNRGPIVACGAHSAIPHEIGHGALKANEFILIDSFPQHGTYYNGDLTRTYLKGTPSKWQTAMYEAVLGAQQVALDMLKPTVDGADVHMAVEEHFENTGFKTDITAGGDYYGFFHGTGHSIGLNVHDPVPPSLSKKPNILELGHVVTVEPGLYYPPNTHKKCVGGVRIEDIVTITKDGYRNLTSLSKDDWVIG